MAVVVSTTVGSSNKYNAWITADIISQDINANTSYVRVRSYLQRNDGYSASAWNSGSIYRYTRYDGANESGYSAGVDTRNNVVVLLKDTYYTIPHGSNGTKTANFSAYCGYVSSSLPAYTISGNYTLTTIPRAGILNTNPTFTFNTTTKTDLVVSTTQYSSSFTHTLNLIVGGTTVATRNITGSTSYNLSLSSSEKNTIYGKTTAGTISATLELKTYNGGTQIGSTSTKTGTITIVGGAPTFTTFTWQPIDSGTPDLTGWSTAISTDNNKTIQSKTIYRVNCTSATAQNGATIASYTMIINGNSKTSSTTTINATQPVSGNDNLIVYATDSRGVNSAQVSKAITVLPYATPYFSAPAIERTAFPNNDHATITFTGKIAQLMKTYGVKDTDYKLEIAYKKTTESEANYSAYSTLTYTVGNDGTINFNDTLSTSFDPDYSYNIKIALSDYYTITYLDLLLSTDTPLISRRKGKVGFGKVPDPDLPDGSIDVKTSIAIDGVSLLDFFYPVGTVYETTSTDLDTTTKMATHFGGTWEAYGAGKVLVAKSADTEFDTIGETGGAKTYSLANHTHTGPSHSHTAGTLYAQINHHNSEFWFAEESASYNSTGHADGPNGASGTNAQSEGVTVAGSTGDAGTGNTGNGGNATINTLPPYIVVFRYRRVS